MIDRATVDRILDATRIEEVIGDFVSLKRRGANYLGLCPFHQDKNPSLSVSSTKQIFKCFACGKAGTAVSFIMEHEKLSYPEALKYLAKKYGIEVVEKEQTPEEIAARMKGESLLIVNEYAQKYYQQLLWDAGRTHLVGLSYFKERKFTDDTIRKFGLGFAPAGGKSFAATAKEEGYKEEYLVDSGLVIKRDDGSLSDRFYDRVMFPIHSLSGRVIAFGGRILTSDKSKAKYINSPETEVYVKNRSLYGIYFAKTAIANKDCCLLVEGYTDVISMHQAGIENVVASSGTSLTVGQISLIKRFTDKIIVIYDGDAAGIKASIRGIDMILQQGMKVEVVLLPPEDDPDSFAKAHDREEIEEFIATNKCDFITFKTNLLLKEIDNDPIRKAQLINDIIESVSVIPDQIERNVYVGMVAKRFDIKEDAVFQKVRQLRARHNSLEQSRSRMDRQQDAPVPPDGYEPVPAGYDENVADVETVASSPQPLTDSYLAVNEKEIIYYLLKFGEYPLRTDDSLLYDKKAVPAGVPTVAEYIRKSLEEDDLQFENPVFKKIFDEYFTRPHEPGEDCEVAQGKIIRFFSTHPDQNVAATMMDVICDNYPLTVKVYRDSLTPEEQLLGKNVPRVVTAYRIKVIERLCAATVKEVDAAFKRGDGEACKEKMRLLSALNTVKNNLLHLQASKK
ncbi:MAG: DNA primase [Bacteroidales bacterium]|nr:DNA primase [Bacteroidales bacterium]